jgi:hypothetical protein
MDIPAAVWLIAGFALAFAASRLMREYLIARVLKQRYDSQLKRVLTDPNSQVKGRFE